MKKLNNFYNSIVDIKIIQDMYDKRVKLNTKNKKKLEKFENNYVSNIIYIKNILNDKKYIPGKYNIFIIKEPKIRLIMSQNVIDKIINHVVGEYFLVNIYDKTLIDTNIATRKNKGTHYGIKLLKKYINEIKNEKFYILKFDISKYFFNLDHEILKKLVRKKIKDKDVLKIIDNIIDSTDSDYVNKTINLLKKKEIEKIIKKYKLELNSKTKIYNSYEGFEFLGFRYFIKNNKLIMKVTNRTKRKFKRKIKNMTKLMKENKITKKEFNQVKNSYLGHLNYGKTKKLIKLNIEKEEQTLEIKEVRIENKNVIIK